MQDKFFDTDDQAIEAMDDGMSDDETIADAVPAIEIVRFDEQDRPAASETRLLSSFLEDSCGAGDHVPAPVTDAGRDFSRPSPDGPGDAARMKRES